MRIVRLWLVREFRRHPFVAVTNLVGLVLALADLLLSAGLIFHGVVYRNFGSSQGLAFALSIEPLTIVCLLPSLWESALRVARSGKANWFPVGSSQMPTFSRAITFVAKQRRHYVILWTVLCILTIIQVVLSLVNFESYSILTVLLLMLDFLIVVFLWLIAFAVVDAEGSH